MQYSLRFPGNLIFGENSVEKLGENAVSLGKKCLLVTGKKSTRESGVLDRVMKSLAKMDMEYRCFDRVSGEPDCAIVDEVRVLSEKECVDFIIGLGGGSSLDVAKAAAGLIGQEQKTVSYLNKQSKEPFEYRGVPFVGVPTTSGTGSEITLNSVLYNPVTGSKKSLANPCFQATLSIVDPTLTYSMSPALTAATGMDALTHAVESYTAQTANEVTRALAAKAIKLIISNIKRAIENGEDKEARADMAQGSMLAGLAFAQTGVGAVHAMSHPLGAFFHIPHGVICALLLPEVIDFNSAVCRERYEEMAEMLKLEGDFSSFLRGLVKEMPIPHSLTEAGYQRGQEEQIAIASFDSRSMYINPRQVEAKDVKEILQRCLA